MTKAAGGRGQPGQLPHPADLLDLLKKGEEQSGGGRWVSTSMVSQLRVSHNLHSLAKNLLGQILFQSFPVEERQTSVEVALDQQTGQTGSEACFEEAAVFCRSLEVF